MMLYNGDCLDVLRKFKDESIDLTVTSPPYDDLRNYNGNISQWSFEKFKWIAYELYRVLKTGAVLVWVVNDAVKDYSESGTSFKQALFFKEIGFNLFDTMIWCKDGGGASSNNQMYAQNTEYMFVFTKGKPKSVNLIKDHENKAYGRYRFSTGRKDKDGKSHQEPYREVPQFSKRNNWWYIPRDGHNTTGHPALFPIAIARDHIISWSNPGDIVLDPFMGSGTTGVACIELRRKFIGIELDKQYYAMSKNRLYGALKKDREENE